MGTKTTRVEVQVLTSKLTWLSKNMFARSPAEEMGGEFVLADPASFQIPCTILCCDASLETSQTSGSKGAACC